LLRKNKNGVNVGGPATFARIVVRLGLNGTLRAFIVVHLITAALRAIACKT
jgi:hypothetical protein